jgi:GTP-binding protein HflX
LVAAFRATLEEVTGADLILHVRDIAHPDSVAQREDVEAILDDLGLGERLDERAIEVLNKIDLLDTESRTMLRNRAARGTGQIPASALNGEGLPELLSAIDRHLAKAARTVTLSVALEDGAAIAWLYDHGQVLARRDDARRAHLRVDLDPADFARFRHRQAEPVGDGG